MRSEKRPSGQGRRSVIEDVRRAQIIDAAVDTFAALGYARTSLSRIAEHAGISKGVISYHFDGKDDLIEHVVEDVYRQRVEFVGPRVQAQQTASGKLRARIRSLAAYLRGHRAQLLALAAIFSNLRDSDGRLRYGDVFNEPYYQSLEAVFRAGQDSGELRPFDPRVMAVTVQAAIEAMVGYSGTYPDHDIEAHGEQLADLFDAATRTHSR